jgi:hypothetical protein
MNALLPRPERFGANGKRHGGLLPPTVVPCHFLPGSSSGSIAPVATRRHNGGKFLEIEVDDRLECDGGWRIAQPIRQSIEPSCVVGLKAEQVGDGIHPSVKPGPPVGGTPISDLRPLLLHFETCAVTGLPLGVAKWRLTWGLAVWHGFDRRYVTLCEGI